jgi:hypothetical protein
MDFSRGFFAISDSSAANPATSHHFLSGFKKALDRIPLFDPERVDSEQFIENIKDELVVMAEGLLTTVSYGESCTFTGILFLRSEIGKTGILFHTGDSYLFKVHPDQRKFVQMSSNNIFMAGRTRRLFQVEAIEVEPASVLILATDGFSNLPFPTYAERNQFVLNVMNENPVDEIPDIIVRKIDKCNQVYDDIGIISIFSDNLVFSKERILF